MKKSIKKRKINFIPLTFVEVEGEVRMLACSKKLKNPELFIGVSTNGLDFSIEDKPVNIKTLSNKKEDVKKCMNFSMSRTPTGFILTYIRKSKIKNGNKIIVAKSLNLYDWNIKSEIIAEDSTNATVIYDKILDHFVLYQDGMFIKSSLTRTLVSWRDESSLLFTSRYGMFDSEKFSIVGSLETREGLLLIYDSSVKSGEDTLCQIGGALFDPLEPKKIIWRSEVPLWQSVVEAKKNSVKPVGFVYFQEKFIVYWLSGKDELLISVFPSLFKDDDIYQYDIVERFEDNPLIEPRHNHDWEIMGTFNPAVFSDEDGVHMFYRALGGDGVSRIGYAKSNDGTYFDRRLPYPVFEPSSGTGLPISSITREPVGYHPAYYTSGGGWGGSEDPRVVNIEDRVYMVYTAFEGWHSVRIAVTYISVDDFKKHNWKWKKPVLISPFGEVHKNWVIFPEKIDGKFAILHGIAPDILVDYIEDFDSFNESMCIKSKAPFGGRKSNWDVKVRGVGPPPIKTDLGWLVFYHAHEKPEPNKYKLGAMILDIKNPKKILYRSEHPILSPEMHYENEGKPGVVYASGAIIRDDNLYIYYGGGDRVVCVAKTPLKQFLDYLVTGNAKLYKLRKISSRFK